MSSLPFTHAIRKRPEQGGDDARADCQSDDRLDLVHGDVQLRLTMDSRLSDSCSGVFAAAVEHL
jgi:hypothetical protein